MRVLPSSHEGGFLLIFRLFIGEKGCFEQDEICSRKKYFSLLHTAICRKKKFFWRRENFGSFHPPLGYATKRPNSSFHSSHNGS